MFLCKLMYVYAKSYYLVNQILITTFTYTQIFIPALGARKNKFR
jgi:hypothetical protein